MRRAVFVAGLLLLMVPAPVRGASFLPRPDTSCAWAAPDCINPVADPRGQFRALRDHGDLMGFRPGPGDHPQPTHIYKHYEGVQRLAPGGGRFLAVSQAGYGTAFSIVRLGSRDVGGERLRSNRLGKVSNDVKPPPADTVVTRVPASPGFSHYGGMQAMGNVLAIGAEDGNASFVAFWNVAEPTRPRRMSTITTSTYTDGAGTVALTKLVDGSYLLIIGGADSNKLAFLRSSPGMSFERPDFKLVGTWKRDELIGGDKKWGDYQSLNLLPGTDRRLYLVGTHRLGAAFVAPGPDFADLHQLEGTPQHPVIRKLEKRHLYCGLPRIGILAGPTLGDACDLDAMGGAYVTPSGGLLLYGGEHYSSGPGDTVQFEEFRPAPHRATCASMDDAWVELYDDTDYDGDRGVMIDYRDRARRDYTNYDRVEKFEDKASAARWCLPAGARFRMYEDKNGCGGKQRDPDRDRSARRRPPLQGDRRGGGGLQRRAVVLEVDRPARRRPCRRCPPPAPTPAPTPTPSPTPAPTAHPDADGHADPRPRRAAGPAHHEVRERRGHRLQPGQGPHGSVRADDRRSPRLRVPRRPSGRREGDPQLRARLRLPPRHGRLARAGRRERRDQQRRRVRPGLLGERVVHQLLELG